MLDIYTHIYSEVMKKDKELTRSCTETECIVKYSAYARPEYVVLGPIRPFPDTLLMYIIWVYEADVMIPFSLAFLNLHPTCLKKKEEDEKTHN